MKILFAACKEMNIDNLENKVNDINFYEVNEIIKFIKGVSEQDCFKVFKSKNNIYQMNQDINIKSKKVFDLYNGISFRQIINKNNPLLKDVYVLSALYGLSYAFDYISPYRYDYTMNNAKKYRNELYDKINSLLKDEDVIINLASKEFYEGIKHHNMITCEFLIKKDDKYIKQSVASKKCRGQMINHLLDNGLEDIKKFNFDNFCFNEQLSNEKTYTFTKE